MHRVLIQARTTWALFALFLLGAGPAVAQPSALWSQCASGRDAAIAACRTLIQSGRETPRNIAIAWYNLGVAYANKRDFAQATDSFTHAIDRDAGYAAAFAQRGLAHEGLRQRERALEDFRKAISLAESRGTSASQEERWARDTASRHLALVGPPGTAAAAAGNPAIPMPELPPFPGETQAAITPVPAARPAQAPAGIARPAPATPPPSNPLTIPMPPMPELPPLSRTDVVTAPVQSPAPQLSSPPVAVAVPPAAAPAPGPVLPLPSRADSGRRVALVIGNSAYRNVAVLPNPVRDAAAVAATLRGLGFHRVILETDLTRERLLDTLRTFSAETEKADWAVIYFAGHGIEMAGTNYLVPVEAKLATDRDVDYEAVALDKVVNAVDGAKRLRLVLLDACRDNPFVKQMRRSVASRSIGRGLAQMEPEAGTLVVYAAKHGQVALDGDEGNSPFVTALISRMKTPGLEVRRLFDLVRDDVMSSTNRRQQPFSYGSVSGSEDFYFVAGR